MRSIDPARYSVSRTHEVHLGGAGGIAESDHETSRRSRGASTAAPQNLKAIAKPQGDRRTPRRSRGASAAASQTFEGIESEIIAQEKNFCERNQKILSTINPGKLRVSNEG